MTEPSQATPPIEKTCGSGSCVATHSRNFSNLLGCRRETSFELLAQLCHSLPTIRCLDLFALNVSTDFLFRNFVSSKEKSFALRSQSARTRRTTVLGGSHPFFAKYLIFKTPGDGFEPPLEEPESSVLPLDDPGLTTAQYYFKQKIRARLQSNLALI